MNKYNELCTEQQLINAIELGAPIDSTKRILSTTYRKHICIKDTFYAIPTISEMVDWINDIGLSIEPYRTACGYLCTVSKIPCGSEIYSQHYEGDDEDSGQFTTRNKALSNAIDFCLNYIKTHN